MLQVFVNDFQADNKAIDFGTGFQKINTQTSIHHFRLVINELLCRSIGSTRSEE